MCGTLNSVAKQRAKILSIGGFFAFILLMGIDLFAHHGNPYMGLLAYVVAPGFMILGAVVALVGAQITGSISRPVRLIARRRPVIIQSLFSLVDGEMPPESEILEFARRLKELKESGAQIPLVQVYSATRPVQSRRVEHLPLRTMRQIAATVRGVAGLRVEVF